MSIENLNADILMEEIEKEYGVDFGDDKQMKLGDYLIKTGYPSLAKLLEVYERENA